MRHASVADYSQEGGWTVSTVSALLSKKDLVNKNDKFFVHEVPLNRSPCRLDRPFQPNEMVLLLLVNIVQIWWTWPLTDSEDSSKMGHGSFATVDRTATSTVVKKRVGETVCHLQWVTTTKGKSHFGLFLIVRRKSPAWSNAGLLSSFHRELVYFPFRIHVRCI